MQCKVDGSLDVTGNLKANQKLICASPSERAHAAFPRLHPLILGMETFVSCSCGINLILPLIPVHERQFLFFLFFFSKHTLKKISVSLHQGKQRVVILWHLAALHQPLSTALCSFSSPLLLRRSQSFTPFSLMALLKNSLRTQLPPPTPCVFSP